MLTLDRFLSLSETYSDAELGDGQRNRGVEGEAGGGQKIGGAQEVSFTETQGEAVDEEKLSKLATDDHVSMNILVKTCE